MRHGIELAIGGIIHKNLAHLHLQHHGQMNACLTIDDDTEDDYDTEDDDDIALDDSDTDSLDFATLVRCVTGKKKIPFSSYSSSSSSLTCSLPFKFLSSLAEKEKK